MVRGEPSPGALGPGVPRPSAGGGGYKVETCR